MDAHRGQLFVDDNEQGMTARISIDGKHLRVVTGEGVWTWAIRHVTITRLNANRFNLALGKEELLFIADNPVTFTFEIVDRVAAMTPSMRRALKRRPNGRMHTKSPQVSESQEVLVPAPAIHSNIWTDLGGGRDEASLFDTLSHLAGTHIHRWDISDDRPAAAVKRCVECEEVFVDLIAAEESDDKKIDGPHG